MNKVDEKFMREAIRDAKDNGHKFGAILVKNEVVISRSGDRPKGDARFHAEIQSIENIFDKLNGDFKNCTLYSTCEPCPMCFYRIWISGISHVVYGASIKDSMESGIPEINISVKELNEKSGNKININEGILKEECISLLIQ